MLTPESDSGSLSTQVISFPRAAWESRFGALRQVCLKLMGIAALNPSYALQKTQMMPSHGIKNITPGSGSESALNLQQID
jgi:hypothetical protein